ADQRFQDPVAVGGVAPGEAPLDATVPVVRLAVLVRYHAHHFFAAHLRLERAADAAIGAGRDHRVLGLADLDDLLLDQRRRRAGLNAGAAAHAFGIHEGQVAGGHAAAETTALDGQRDGALHFVTRAHATRADDALRRIVLEIRIRRVLHVVDVVLAFVAVTHFAQADGAGHVLKLAVAVRGAGQTVERMVADVQLHHAAADAGEPLGLSMHHHAGGN